MELQSGTRIKAMDTFKPGSSGRRLFSLLACLAVGAVVFGLTLWVSHVITTTESDTLSVSLFGPTGMVEQASDALRPTFGPMQFVKNEIRGQ